MGVKYPQIHTGQIWLVPDTGETVTIAEESTDSSTYISAYNMSRVRDVVRDWKEATVRR